MATSIDKINNNTEILLRSGRNTTTGRVNNNRIQRTPEPKPYPGCLKCPVTGKPFGIGFSVQTFICKDPENPGEVWAEHIICDVRPGFIADQLGLKNGQKLLTIGAIMTDGMTAVILQAQLMALNINNLEIAVQRVQSKDGTRSQNAIIIDARLELDPDPEACGLCVMYTEAFEYIIPDERVQTQSSPTLIRRLSITDGSCTAVRVDEIADLSCDDSYNIDISHVSAVCILHIEHPESEQYLKIENGKLVLYPLQKDDETMKFRGRLLSGYDETIEPLQLCVFRESTPRNTSFVTPINTTEVGIQNIPKLIQPDVKVLNSDDPRLYQRIPVSTSASCFMSTALQDHYLAVINGEVVMKLVLEEERAQDTTIHFRLRKSSPDII